VFHRRAVADVVASPAVAAVVRVSCSNLQEFVEHIVTHTNMRSLSPISALDPSCNFLAANLYAKSIFGAWTRHTLPLCLCVCARHVASARFCVSRAGVHVCRPTTGEDALVNVSVENRPDGSIRGHIRIRSKTQGVALSLGDKITETQRRKKRVAA
jgi:coatomer subunit beta